MKKDFLKNCNYTGSIHTFGVKSNKKPNISDFSDPEIIRSSYMQKTNIWIIRINPNKINGDIFSYSEFCSTANTLFKKMGVENCTYWRTDIRLDSYVDNFKEYYKLNLLLINLFSILFNDNNKQAVCHMLTQRKDFSDISSKNQYWEVKYYDKRFQKNDTDPAKARLEFRSLKSTNKDGYEPHEIKEIWFKRLDKITDLYDKLQDECNNLLLGAYKAYCNYNNKSDSSRDLLTNFFSTYINSMTVFTKKQLINFLIMCGVNEKNVNDRADYICSKYKIEFYSKSVLLSYINKIKDSMSEFFDC